MAGAKFLLVLLYLFFKSSRSSLLDRNLDISHEFELFIKNYNRSYENDAEELKIRKKYFAQNLLNLAISNVTEKEGGAIYGITSFMDWSQEEKKAILLDPKSMPEKNCTWVYQNSGNSMKNSNVDWRNTGAVNDVRNQGQCGSCWAFAVTAAVEVQENYWSDRTGSKRIAYSEQYLIDCTDAGSCKGGRPQKALEQIKKKGFVRQSELPYDAKKEECPLHLHFEFPVNGVYEMTGNVDYILDWVENIGPVTATFRVCEDFFSYTGGLYSRDCRSGGYHAVTIIGYGTSGGVDYWLARNSWGKSWGEAGYFKIKRGADLCGFESIENLTVMIKMHKDLHCSAL
ncbi:unnamed protein product, partial [Mesorhabditis spiculigera]